MKVTITQAYDPEIWEDVKPNLDLIDLGRTTIKESPSGEAVLIWTFELSKPDAQTLAVMLEHVAALGNPQTGLDMEPSKRELWS